MSALFTKDLPLLAEAPNGIKKLRELILELAVRGKLVPQEPGDESASVLLGQIYEEKAQVAAEGTLKRQKPLPEFNPECLPFELPSSWTWTRLGEITNFGITSKADVIEEDTWVLDLEDIEKDTSKLLRRVRFSERKSLSNKNMFLKGDVLYGKLRPYLNKVLVADQGGCCTTEILPFRCYGPFSAHYFQIALRSPYFVEYVNSKSYGMKMPRLGTEDGRKALFPLPPLAEQHRIGAKVDGLMALCDRLESRQADTESIHTQLVQALLDNLTEAADTADFAASWQRLSEHFDTLFTTEASIDAIKQTILQLAVMGKLVPQDPDDESVGDAMSKLIPDRARSANQIKSKSNSSLLPAENIKKPFGLPSKWAWERLQNVSFFQEGPGIMAKDFRPSGVPLIRISGVRSELVTLDGCNFLDAKMVAKKWNHFRLELNDIILSSSASLGMVSKVSDEVVGSVAYTGLIRFKPSELILDDYLIIFFRSSEFARQINTNKRGAAILHFGPTHLREMVVPIPPLPEQNRIIAKVDQMMALCGRLKKRLSQARQLHETLTTALVSDALDAKGKLPKAEVIDLSAYVISKLASQRTFGRVAHMKLLFLTDLHLSLNLMEGYRRHAAGPLDTSIYHLEERAEREGLYSTSVERLKSGQEKISYRIGAQINRSVDAARVALGASSIELDRIIKLFEGRKTDDLEVVATLYAVWNDALAEGKTPDDDWLVSEFRSSWHEKKGRFAPEVLHDWLSWMRDNELVPSGNGAVTKPQATFMFS